MRVLVVEDDAILALVCAGALESAGHSVAGPVYDIDGFRQVSKDCVDLAIVDINLAGNDEGLDIAEELRTQHIPALFVSGQVAAARKNTHLALGLLRKPYDSDDLLIAVEFLRKALLSENSSLPNKPAMLELF